MLDLTGRKALVTGATGGIGEEIARRFLASSSPASVYKDTIQEEFTIKRVR